MSASVIEDMVVDVSDYIEANICTYLDAISVTAGDGIILGALKDVAITDGNPYDRSDWPAMLVQAPNITERAISIGFDELIVQMQFLFVLTSGDYDNLSIMAMRYVEAMRQLFLADQTLGGAVDRLGQLEDGTLMDAVIYPGVAGDKGIKLAQVTAQVIKDITR